MATDLLDLVDAFLHTELGVDLAPEALVACESVTQDQIELVRSHVAAWDRQHHDALVQVHITGSEEKNAALRRQGERPFSAMFTHPYNGLQAPQVEQVKRQLLFFPKVAIVRPDIGWAGELDEQRAAFKAFVASLLEFQELLRDGTVELIPLAGFYSNEIEGGAGLIRHACETDQRVIEWVAGNRNLLTEFSAGARRGDPYFDAGIRIASALTYGHELVATHRFVGELYEVLMGRNSLAPQSFAIGSTLDKIQLPRLSGLNWRDIKMIREDEASFRRWQADLQDVIATVDPNLPPDEFVRRFNAVAVARLSRAAIDLDKELKESAALTRARKGMVTFGIGAIAAASTLATFGLPAGATVWTTLLKSAEAGGVTAALQFLWGTKRMAGKRALRGHYAVFEGSR